MSDDLAQHRRELDAALAAITSIGDVATAQQAHDRRVWVAIDELRDDLRALANRIEGLARRPADENGDHSVRHDLKPCRYGSRDGHICDRELGHEGRHSAATIVSWRDSRSAPIVRAGS